MLLPAAARLSNFDINEIDVEDQSFCKLLPKMKHLKRLNIYLAWGNCEKLLQAVSLMSLETLILESHVMIDMTLPSADDLLHLANGPIRRSLVNLNVQFGTDDLVRRESLRRCFNEKLVPSFEKRHVRSQEITFVKRCEEQRRQ
mmetsp:Transcript_16274/g.41897  ORF Transcript_16274/g.41897 Transcript_16274/m.41897 type:complete len:144 (-) Transcript_16274:58-489(-)